MERKTKKTLRELKAKADELAEQTEKLIEERIRAEELSKENELLKFPVGTTKRIGYSPKGRAQKTSG